MAIKKDAAKADIGPKKQVKATFAECTAEEPLKCKYHGIKQLEGILNSLFQKHGEQNTSGLEKQDGKYLLHFASAQHPKQVVYDLMKILDGKGFGCKYLGTDESGSGINYEIAPKDGKGFVTPNGEAELQDADTLSSSSAPDKKKDDSEADESKDEVDNLGDAGGNTSSLEDWKKLQKKLAWDDTKLAQWKEMILKGTLEGEPLQDDKKQAVEGTLYLINAPQAIKDAWKETKNKAKTDGAKKKDPFAELENMDVDSMLNDSELDADLMDNFDELEDMAEEATEDLEAELLGNTDFDDLVFFDDDGNKMELALSDNDIKDLVSFKGVKEEHFEQNPELLDTYKAIITTGKNPGGEKLNENQVTWWNDLLDKTKSANPAELPALKVLAETMKKVNGEGEAARDNGAPFTDEQLKDWLNKMGLGYAIKYKSTYDSIKEQILKGTMNGKPMSKEGKENLKSKAWALDNHPVSQHILKMFGEEEQGGVNAGGEETAAQEPTMESLMSEMQSIIDKIHDTGMALTWDAQKGMSLGNKFGDAVNAGDVKAAQKALDNFKAYIHQLETGGEEDEVAEELSFTDDELLEAAAKKWGKPKSFIPKENLDNLKYSIETGLWQANGEALNEKNQAHLKELAEIAGADSALAKKINQTLAKIKSGEIVGTDGKPYVSVEDIKDFFEKCGIKKPSLLSDENLAATKECIATGKWKGKALSDKNIKWYGDVAKKAPDHKVAKAIKAMVDEEKIKKGIDNMTKGMGSGLGMGYDKFKPTSKKVSAKMKSALLGTSDVDNDDASSGDTMSVGMAEASAEILKPLEHDESKFPQDVTQKELEKAIEHPIKTLGGHGRLGTRLIQIGDKQYVCKAATGQGAKAIRNGYNADMAYRAGGIYAPDAQLYDFGDGKVYKLSEFISGKTLIDVWKKADEAKRDELRKELLKGYPLDILFSNYDVLGTSPEDSQSVTIEGPDGKPMSTYVAYNNVLVGDDGHLYRVDNDGSFDLKGTGGKKGANWKWKTETDEKGNVIYDADGKPKKKKVSAIGGLSAPVEHELYDSWEQRKWIDDFRTFRRNEKNAGIFDRYSTADIFLSAGNINLDAVVKTLPDHTQEALAKPLHEMKQMTWRALNIALGGYKDNGFISMALDASYEASKRGLREICSKSVSWNNSGFGVFKSHWGNYSPQPFGETPPHKPEDPTKILADKLKNEDYTGGKIGDIIFNAAKTINYHGGEKKIDAKGNPIGNPMSNPDYAPNSAKIADWEKIDRDKLAELAKTDANAKTLLGLYDTIAYSKENGWKKPIGLVPSGLAIQGELAADYLSPTEKKIHEDMASAIKEYKEKLSEYEKKLSEYEKRKEAHKKKEEKKAQDAGGSPYHNFHDFAQAFMDEGVNTDGIAHRVETNGIAPIESSMGAQKGSSYAEAAVKWKVREMMALGFTPEQILEMASKKKLYKGSYYTDCINKYLLPHKDSWARDMNSQAMYLGMNMVKMENEHNDLYDKASGIVFLNRNIGAIPQGINAAEKKIYSDSSATGWVGPHVDSAADCMQFEANWWHEPYKQVYAVPLSRIVCCANNEHAAGGGYGYGDEQEYVGNLYNLPCWVYHGSQNLTWKGAIDEAKKSSGMKGFLKKLANRLGLFNTLPKK